MIRNFLDTVSYFFSLGMFVYFLYLAILWGKYLKQSTKEKGWLSSFISPILFSDSELSEEARLLKKCVFKHVSIFLVLFFGHMALFMFVVFLIN